MLTTSALLGEGSVWIFSVSIVLISELISNII